MAENVEISLSFAKAWEIIENGFSLTNYTISVSEVALQEAYALLVQNGITHILEEWFFQVLQTYLRDTVSEQFWAFYQEKPEPSQMVNIVAQSIGSLHSLLGSVRPCIERLQSLKLSSGVSPCKANLQGYAHVLYKAVLLSKVNKVFLDMVHETYAQAYRAFDASTHDHGGDDNEDDDDDDDDDIEQLMCKGCDNEKDSCRCQIIMEIFHTMNAQLKELGLLERLSGEPVTALINDRIHHHVEHKCKGNFENPYLEPLMQWLDTKVVGWLELVYGSTETGGDGQSSMAAHRDRLCHYLYTVYANVRILQLFNIIVDFPESEPALTDLKECLEKTDLRSNLIISLKLALESRLLHPGVNTADILTAYISAIRALRVLDSSGVLLDRVCEPVRKYLRNREDTVRCIVSSLTEEGSSELSDELNRAQPLVLDDSYHSDDEMDDWDHWQPDPIDADPGKLSVSRRSSDIISMLVNIYGSKELFVNEYSTLLADRLLTQYNYDTEREIRYLELLKLRFGESQLHYCEVMLKDIADSKRINTNIEEKKKGKKASLQKADQDSENTAPQQKNPALQPSSSTIKAESENPPPQQQDMNPTNQQSPSEEIPVSGMILSAQFWPSFREEKLDLPEIFQRALDQYKSRYEALKGNRTLTWKPHLGLVNIELELKDRTLTFNVSPVHAAIIYHFQEKASWTVEDLSAVLHMPSAALRRKMAYWQSQGLLREDSPDYFVLVEEQKGRSGHDLVLVEEDEVESAMASAQDQREEELQVLWSYVVGMLTNLECLPLERIHSMLRMFVMQGPSALECSIHELKAFLDKKVKDQKLLYSGGVYRLPKPS